MIWALVKPLPLIDMAELPELPNWEKLDCTHIVQLKFLFMWVEDPFIVP